jgi:predicted ATPase/class 3 adenylate cyclase
MAAVALPTGTVTFLFTDVEGSSRLLAEAGNKYDYLLAQYRQLLIEAVRAHDGHVVEGQGDAFFATFSTASAALEAAIEAQEAIQEHKWPADLTVRVRIGLHSGEVKLAGERYVGMEVHRAARLGDAGHGGQILVSDATRFLLGDSLPEGVGLLDLGQHRLRDLPRVERIHQVTAAGLLADFPPLRTVDEGLSRVRVPLSTFIGREKEKAEVEKLLEDPTVRLLTLTGAGGAGKTRLALEVVVELQDDYEHGAVLVPLASVSSADTVLVAILQAADVREIAGRAPLDTLKDFLHRRQMLVVLDNFEHVMDAAPVVAELLEACDRIKLLVTSREVLRLTAEQEYVVPPLSMPAEGDTVDVQKFEAVQLFLDRAKAVDRDFGLTDANARDVAAICRLLDGLPLAIELAAARVRLFSPASMARKLEEGLDLLVGGPRDLPERQRALRNAIDWSYQLLDKNERSLFDRLGAFAGGWTLDAVAAICTLDSENFDVFEGLASLVDKSLVYRRDDPEGGSRFALLRSIREFAVQRLEASDVAEQTREAHADFFLEYSRKAEPDLRTGEQAQWIGALEADFDNIRAAMQWSLDKGRPDRIVEIGWSLWPFWWVLYRFDEGMSWMQRTLADGNLNSPDARGKADVVLGILAFGSGKYEIAMPAFQQGLELCESEGNDFGAGLALGFVGIMTALGDAEAGWDLITQARDKFEAVPDEWGIAFTLYSLGWICALEERYEEALDWLEKAIARARPIGEKVALAYFLIDAGWTKLWMNEVAQADTAFDEALRLLLEVGDRVGAARVLEGLGGTSLATGDAQRAAILFGAAEGTRRSVGAGLWLLDTAKHSRTEAAIREALGDDDFDRAWREGTALSPEEVQPLVTAAATHGR